MAERKKNTKTAITLAPLTVDEALSALLKTPPPQNPDETRKPKKKKKRK